MKTANGNGTNNNVRPLHGSTPVANENVPGGIPARDITSALADRVFAGERISHRLFHPLPLSGLLISGV